VGGGATWSRGGLSLNASTNVWTAPHYFTPFGAERFSALWDEPFPAAICTLCAAILCSQSASGRAKLMHGGQLIALATGDLRADPAGAAL
jgi:hypothetical protein